MEEDSQQVQMMVLLEFMMKANKVYSDNLIEEPITLKDIILRLNVAISLYSMKMFS